MNRLRYLIESRNIYRRLAKRTRQAADQASLQSSEASVALSLAEIRAYEAELHASHQINSDGSPKGRRYSLLGFVWSSPCRRDAEASIAARNLAVAAAREASRRNDDFKTAMREREEEAAFVAGNVVRAEEALQPWSHRYQPERALAIHETALTSAIAQMSDEELDLALSHGDLTQSQYRELMVLSGRDDVVRRIDAGDIPAPGSMSSDDFQDEPAVAAAAGSVPGEADDADEEPDVEFVQDETDIDGPVVEAEDGPPEIDPLPTRPLFQDNDEALKLVADPG